ncbi:hypothetical protein [Paenibacillus alvei]|uniref:hypothetical protein n=1 Tax=Paenibacillus alvei TaxID=44250 RepID=UPI0018CF6F04|nr:hypothetical protein [Paenibacillus alvei]MBG9736461.1 hypothetical protein [Paenibacillus alvei]MBG9736491.1 hypothetical protein [Paenibacillus alvei]MBG9736509.1 hypothetical protein [Paenibacillus alvei]MBG9736602.1 hypothetical protein [Paenibacillus alvei]MBG9745586.1 hypothetical protein [Paenibacillus alvei]
MENVIEKLRELEAKVDTTKYPGVRDENWYAIEEILEAYKPDGYVVEEVHEEHGEGGRWTSEKTVVTKVTQADGKIAYFEVWCEEPATEMQEGGDFSYSFTEVVPKEVTVIKYTNGRSE